MPAKNPTKVAQKALQTLSSDLEERLLEIDRYERGHQQLPYMPDNADAEYKLHGKRAITNVMPFLIGTPAQMMFVDSFSRGRTSDQAVATLTSRAQAVQPEWDHFQKSGMDKKQAAIYRGALKFGHSFVLTFKDEKRGVLSKGLSALKTTALYEDPANDEDPYAAITVTRWPVGNKDDDDFTIGLATLYDNTFEYPVTFKSLDDTESVRVGAGRKHGSSVCPVTRFTAAVDLEGRTCGVVEPMFRLQDRINQTVFDLLIVQSFASFKVRTISGMAPPIKMRPVDVDGNTVLNPTEDDDRIVEWRPVIDPDTGRPIPDQVNLNAKRLFFARDPETKFGTLDETPLDGFIKAIELGFRHMAALSQTPPHHILGEISNISAEALEAAETALARKVEEFKTSFGESWERVFRVAAEIGETEGAEDFAGEVQWRNLNHGSLNVVSDGLAKLAAFIPGKGLRARVPGVTARELAYWEELDDTEPETAQQALASATQRASSSSRPSFRLNASASGSDVPAAEPAA